MVKNEKVQHLYKYAWHWQHSCGNPVAHRPPPFQKRSVHHRCALLTVIPFPQVKVVSCSTQIFVDSIVNVITLNCPELSTLRHNEFNLTKPARQLTALKFPTKKCRDGSLIHTFHRCPDVAQKTHTGTPSSGTEELSPSGFPLFYCRYGPPVHYTVVCDGVKDCVDGSDETDCKLSRLTAKQFFACKRITQFVQPYSRCDSVPDCLDGSDEENCNSCGKYAHGKILCTTIGCLPGYYQLHFSECDRQQDSSQTQDKNACNSEVNGTAVVRQDGYGMSCLSPVTPDTNMEGMFYCTVGDYYIPSYMINNGVWDCYHGEDEALPPDFTCPGYYRCHETSNCLHPDLVCDGIVHCPNRDDELYCCSAMRECCSEGAACSYSVGSIIDEELIGSTLYDIVIYTRNYVRLLHLKGSFGRVGDLLVELSFVQFLNISSCDIHDIQLFSMPMLKIVDLSFNRLVNVSSLTLNLAGLTPLNLSGNPIVISLASSFVSLKLPSLLSLTITCSSLGRLQNALFSRFKELSLLNMKSNEIHDYESGVFDGLDDLQSLYVDDPKLCCPFFHDGKTIQCHAPEDELSSCDDLLRSDTFRIFLWVFVFLALLGNGGVLVYRACTYKHTSALPFRLLVTNLCASDLLMGIYMLMIGVADAVSRGSYVGQERDWRASSRCTAAGFVALLSSEVSALVVCLITLDRALSICFPFKTTIHLTRRQACLLCLGVWILGLMLAATPFLAQLQFYGETAICLPLPITRRQFSGQTYSFAVFIVLNFVLVLLTGTGQVAIFRAIKVAGRASGKGSQRRQQDLTIARRLFLIVLTDFLCWFPIGLMGLLAYTGDVPISGEVNVAAAIFVLPINSALNPFLYTLNGLLEKWAQKRFLEKTRRLLAKLHTEIPKMSEDTVEEILLTSLKSCQKGVLENIALACLSGSRDFNIQAREKITMTVVNEMKSNDFDSHFLEKITVACLQKSKDFDILAVQKMALILFQARNQIEKEKIMQALKMAVVVDDVTSETV